MKIVKASGEEEEFSEGTIKESSMRAGLPEGLAEEVARKAAGKARSGMTSEDVYRNVVEEIGRKDQGAAFRYSLKKAIMSLGPTGYPFEKYVAEILNAHGYQTSTSQHLPGRCVDHEIDVLVERQGEVELVECKYHNRRGTRSDVKVPLYVQARFLDVREGWEKGRQSGSLVGAWLVTNTKLTSQAIKYGECVGMSLTAWRYPKGAGLERMIEEKRLYPVTILPSLNKSLWQQLSRVGVLLAKDLEGDIERLAKRCRVPVGRLRRLNDEAKRL
jgi:Holliday junction resolvase-like predicted endonuclease